MKEKEMCACARIHVCIRVLQCIDRVIFHSECALLLVGEIRG